MSAAALRTSSVAPLASSSTGPLPAPSPLPSQGPRRRAVAVSLTGPRSIGLVEEGARPLLPGAVRVRTLYSGISAGTEMTAYRDSNVYLTKHSDPAYRLLDQDPAVTLEMVLDFRSGGDGHPEEGS